MTTTDSPIELLKESAKLLSEIPAPYSYGLWERMCVLERRIATFMVDESIRKDEAQVKSDEDNIQKVFDIIQGCKHYWDASVDIVSLLKQPVPVSGNDWPIVIKLKDQDGNWIECIARKYVD